MFVGDLEIFENAARMVHILMLTLCFWIVIAADLTAAKSSMRPLTDFDLARLHRFHRALATGLVLLWISGVALIGILTGFELSQFSPKLFAKIIVVTVLTINAGVIGRIALPFYERNRGMILGDFNGTIRMRLAVCGAFSTSSWVSAFCLGAIPALKTASTVTLVNLLGLFYVGNAVVAAILVLLLQRKSAELVVNARLGFQTSRNISLMEVHKAA